MNELSIAKGTFYYYFKSKEEVMDAIIMRTAKMIEAYAESVAAEANLTVQQKLIKIFSMNFPQWEHKAQMIQELHQPENIEMHQKSLTQTVLKLTPAPTKIAEQGIKEGLFATPYPKECIANFLVSTQFLLDEGLFHWEPQELQRLVQAQLYIMERSMGAAEGSLQSLLQLFDRQ